MRIPPEAEADGLVEEYSADVETEEEALEASGSVEEEPEAEEGAPAQRSQSYLDEMGVADLSSDDAPEKINRAFGAVLAKLSDQRKERATLEQRLRAVQAWVDSQQQAGQAEQQQQPEPELPDPNENWTDHVTARMERLERLARAVVDRLDGSAAAGQLREVNNQIDQATAESVQRAAQRYGGEPYLERIKDGIRAAAAIEQAAVPGMTEEEAVRTVIDGIARFKTQVYLHNLNVRETGIGEPVDLGEQLLALATRYLGPAAPPLNGVSDPVEKVTREGQRQQKMRTLGGGGAGGGGAVKPINFATAKEEEIGNYLDSLKKKYPNKSYLELARLAEG